MSDSRQVTINFISKLAQDIFSRAIRGECKYEQDKRQLEKLLKQAQTLQATELELQILNTIAVTDSLSGHITESYEHFRALYERHVELNDVNGMVTALNNQGVTLQILGKFTQALDAYDEGIRVITNATVPPYQIRSYGLLISGRMGLLLEMERFDEVEASFRDLQKIADEFVNYSRIEYVRTMIYAYPHMAEVELQRAKIDEAITNYNLAASLAQGAQMKLEIGGIEFTKAHIEYARHDLLAADTHWQLGEDTIDSLNTPIMAGSQYMSEARYLRHKGIIEKANYFANRALALFEQHDLMENQEIIREEFFA